MRTVLQKELINLKLPNWLSIIITALCSASLFYYLDNLWIVLFIFIVQLILSISYLYTRRIATTIIAQIVAVVILLIFNG
jgi:membrane protease YdiL (CAAX protease family)